MRVQVVVDDLQKFLDDTIKALALGIVARLVAASSEGGTPVDTGWASANWVPRIGQRAGITAGERPKRGNSASRKAQEQGIAQVATGYKHNSGNGKIIISNNVPYIIKLNFGSSPQAKKGFVQRAIVRTIVGLS